VSLAETDMAAALGLRQVHRRPRPAGADLPPAGGAAQVARAGAARTPRGTVCAVRADQGDESRRQVRCRRRDRRAAQLREQGQARAASDTVNVEGKVEPLGKGRTFTGQHILVPLRGWRSRSTRSTSRSGAAGEVRARVHRRRAESGQVGHPDRLSDGQAGGADDRLRAAASGLAPAGLRERRGMFDYLGERDGVVHGSAATAQGLRARGPDAPVPVPGWQRTARQRCRPASAWRTGVYSVPVVSAKISSAIW